MRFIADEDFDHDILRGVRLRVNVDIVHVHDVDLSGKPDERLLEWAAAHNRILLTHNVSTMVSLAYENIAAGKDTPGVFVVAQLLPIGRAIEELVTIIECSAHEDWEGQVQFLPL